MGLRIANSVFLAVALVSAVMVGVGCGARAPEPQMGEQTAEFSGAPTSQESPQPTQPTQPTQPHQPDQPQQAPQPQEAPQPRGEASAQAEEKPQAAPPTRATPSQITPKSPEAAVEPKPQPAQPRAEQQARPGGEESRPGGRFPGGRGAEGFGILMRGDVQKELGITEEQEAKLRDGLRALAPREGERPDPEELANKVRSVIASVLTAAQQKRLSEISLQREGPSALARKEIADKVGLSASQSEQIVAIYRQLSEELRQNRQNMQNMTDEERRAAFEKFRKAREEADKKALALLNSQQKQKWESLLGKPFKFESQGFRGGGQADPGRARGNVD